MGPLRAGRLNRTPTPVCAPPRIPTPSPQPRNLACQERTWAFPLPEESIAISRVVCVMTCDQNANTVRLGLFIEPLRGGLGRREGGGAGHSNPFPLLGRIFPGLVFKGCDARGFTGRRSVGIAGPRGGAFLPSWWFRCRSCRDFSWTSTLRTVRFRSAVSPW